LKSILKNVSYTIFSNLINFFLAAVITFFAPKLLGFEEYGYFQLYLLYSSYVGFLHFGWADGVFLRYGGKYYNELEKKKFSAQFWLNFLFELVIGLIIFFIIAGMLHQYEKSMVLRYVGIAVVLGLPCTFLQYILQATNRMKEYAISLVFGRIIYAICVCVSLLFGNRSFSPIIISDLIGKAVTLVIAIFFCRDILKTRPEPINISIKEAATNIKVGSALVIANIASTLIIGIVQLAIENQWDISTFGKISLTISLSNLLMVLIRAIALVIFPMLRRTPIEKLTSIYDTMRTCLMVPLLGMLMFYYPVREVMSKWLPQYAESLKYMALLFPICVFESKTSMLIETYTKALRKEKWLLYGNIVTVCLSAIFTGTTVYFLHNLDFAVVSITLLLAFRGVFLEMKLSKILAIDVKKDIIYELLMTAIFMSSGWFLGGINGIIIYLLSYLLYLFLKRKEIGRILKHR